MPGYKANGACPVMTKAEFLKAAEDPESFIASLEKRLGPVEEAEKEAWRNSVCGAMRDVLASPVIPEDTGVAVEYTIKRLGRRVDMLLSGKGRDGGTVILIIELKQWTPPVRACDDTSVSLEFELKSRPHPSFQAEQYARCLRWGLPEARRERFSLRCIGYLHNYRTPRADSSDAVLELSRLYPGVKLFYAGNRQKQALAAEIASLLPEGDGGAGIREMDDAFDIHAVELSRAVSPDMREFMESFCLSEEQARIAGAIEAAVAAAGKGGKRVIIVEGGPGSGKSVVALYALAKLRARRGVKNRCFYVSKSKALRDVFCKDLPEWSKTGLHKGMFWNPPTFIRLKEAEKKKAKEKAPARLTIVDECQRLLEFRTTGESQARSIIELSDVSVLFFDERQIVASSDDCWIDATRDRCRKERIDVQEYRLSAQMRCGCSDAYLRWVESALGLEARPGQIPSDYDVQVMDSFDEFYSELRRLNGEKPRARMLAGKCWEWRSEKDFDGKTDFPEAMRRLRWSRTVPGKPWAAADDAFDQIGNILTCQGVEFSYAGVIIGPDLVCKNGALETDWRARAGDDNTINRTYAAKCEKKKPDRYVEPDTLIRNTYRVLLTRGLLGCRIYCANRDGTPNTALAAYFKKRLGK